MLMTGCKGDVWLHAFSSSAWLQSVVGHVVPTLVVVTLSWAKPHYVQEETVGMTRARADGPMDGDGTEFLGRLVSAFVRRMAEALVEPSVGRKC